ncbi:response regulator transcription factor [Arthrobacter sp. KBS0703]|uniref:response regulator transcription factor n=1 Tax=Arthrobacter sp. KBS0703 TaxID=1955698 RepID=UPI00098FDD7C|nr:response regulator transcription factor [Arthrobacter sp. KBS0703]TSE15748.1 response regulator transcription factor [Arthrobacter sp. KBS0703]
MSRILVIEDDETIGAVLVSALSANGYSVQWQLSGGGLVQAAAGGPDLVLLDLGLPGRFRCLPGPKWQLARVTSGTR